MSKPEAKIVNFPSDVDAELADIEKAIERKAAADAIAAAKGPANLLPPPIYTEDDLSNARQFIAAFGSDLMYVRERKEFYIWSGTHWTIDNTNFVYELATQFVSDLYSPDKITSAEKYKHAKRSNNAAGIDAMLKIVKNLKTVSIDTNAFFGDMELFKRMLVEPALRGSK